MNISLRLYTFIIYTLWKHSGKGKQFIWNNKENEKEINKPPYSYFLIPHLASLNNSQHTQGQLEHKPVVKNVKTGIDLQLLFLPLPVPEPLHGLSYRELHNRPTFINRHFSLFYSVKLL